MGPLVFVASEEVSLLRGIAKGYTPDRLRRQATRPVHLWAAASSGSASRWVLHRRLEISTRTTLTSSRHTCLREARERAVIRLLMSDMSWLGRGGV